VLGLFLVVCLNKGDDGSSDTCIESIVVFNDNFRGSTILLFSLVGDLLLGIRKEVYRMELYSRNKFHHLI